MKATFGAGCFWGVESAFRKINGVLKTQVGYAGGNTLNPTYKDVCTGITNHAEVVEVEYDDEVVAYQTLLDTFFKIHDPTTLNRQGPDVGTQYRSVIFTHTEEQNLLAKKIVEIEQSSGKYIGNIVTQIQDAPQFYRAEEYHQQYFEKNPGRGCHIF